MEEVTIIIPIYNAEKYLRKCLDSVRRISFPISIILVDDGSTDSSGSICDEYVAIDSRFRVIHQANKGLAEARSIGIKVVNSQFLTFIDSDDYIEADQYSQLMADNFDDIKKVDVVCLGMKEEYQGKCYEKFNKFSDGVYTEQKLKKMCESMLSNGQFFDFGILPNAVCKIYKTNFVKRNLYNVSPCVRIGEDADMTYQLMTKAKSVYVLNKTPYHYCRREGSMMWRKVDSKAIEGLENDLKRAFVESEYENDMLLSQLKDYMDFIYLLSEPSRVLGESEFFENKTDRIALYGAGGVGRAIKNDLDNNFTLWVDKNYSLFNMEGVLPVDSLIEKKECYDKVFIAISNIEICEKIRRELLAKGIDKPICYFRMNYGGRV